MKQPAPAKATLSKKKPESVAPFPEHGHVCLNCNHEVSNNFCSVCGQSTSTHRLSIKHFLLHDLVHSIWHVDRGIFFTLKEVLVRPGYAALEYIRGRRAGRFPILTLLLLLTGLALWLYGIGKPPEAEHFIKAQGPNAEFLGRISAFITHNEKWLLLSFIPVGSLSTWIVFRRSRLNYTEQLLVNCYVFGGLLVLLIILRLIVLAFPGAGNFISNYNGRIGFLFYLIGYWQAYRKVYQIRGLIWRIMALLMLNVLLLIVVVGLVLGATIFLNPEIVQPGTLNLLGIDTAGH